MLKYIQDRFKTCKDSFVTMQEFKFYNLLKVVLDSGYVFEANTLDTLLRMSGIIDVQD